MRRVSDKTKAQVTRIGRAAYEAGFGDQTAPQPSAPQPAAEQPRDNAASRESARHRAEAKDQ